MPQWGGELQYLRGLELFNREFFEGQEALEDAWRAAPRPEEVSAAADSGRRGASPSWPEKLGGGAVSAEARAVRNLSAYPEDFGGIHLPRLLHSLANWQKTMDEGTSAAAVNRITVLDHWTAGNSSRGVCVPS